MGRSLLGVLLTATVLTAASPATSPAQVLPTGFRDSLVVGGMNFPVGFDFLPDGRVLVVEQASARVRMVQNGALSSVDPVLTVPEVRTGSERGLLGIAVDPRWPSEPYIYVHSTSTTGRIRISRFLVGGDLTGTFGSGLAANPTSRYDLIDDIPDAQFNHNGGTLRFGPDGLLYVSLGEDASPCAAQDTVSLRGVLLRLEVRDCPNGPGRAPRALITPSDNPHVTHPDSNARLVAVTGLRNPFRVQIDPVRNWLIVGDVGQVTYEELDVVRLPGATGTMGGTLGSDFGWPWFEGPAAFTTCSGSNAGRIGPSYSYDRTGAAGGASIIAAGAYRPQNGAADWPAEYHGDVFMSDYYSGVLRRLRVSGSQFVLAPTVAGQPDATAWGTGFGAVSDFRVGPDGSFWYVRQAVSFQSNTGSLRRIVYDDGPPPPPPPPPPGPFTLALAVTPQPAVGQATVTFTPSTATRVTARIHDLSGRTIRTLLAGVERAAGRNDVAWDGRDDAGNPARAGLYVLRLVAGGLERSHRVMLIR